MILKPILETPEENKEFMKVPYCREILQMSIDYYKKIGFIQPWVGYFAESGGKLVGSAGFKGKPVNGTIEIAYGVFEQFRKQGIGTEICRMMVELALKTDPSLKINARTLPENNFSVWILQKNKFVFSGTVNDPEDGDVWEWEYSGML